MRIQYKKAAATFSIRHFSYNDFVNLASEGGQTIRIEK
jgi:hypothetical protein